MRRGVPSTATCPVIASVRFFAFQSRGRRATSSAVCAPVASRSERASVSSEECLLARKAASPSYDCVVVRNPRVYGDFVGFGGCGSVYFRVVGMLLPISSNARRWMVVGVASVGIVGVFGSVP